MFQVNHNSSQHFGSYTDCNRFAGMTCFIISVFWQHVKYDLGTYINFCSSKTANHPPDITVKCDNKPITDENSYNNDFQETVLHDLLKLQTIKTGLDTNLT